MSDGPSARNRLALTWGLPAVGLLLAAFAGACTLGSADEGGSGSAASTASARSGVSRSSTIAAAPSGRTLWLTSPDDDQVVEVDAATLAVRRSVAVPGQPQELTMLGSQVLVTGAQSTDLTTIAIGGTRASTTRIPLPCGGSRAVVALPSGVAGARQPMAVVTCPTDDLVVLVDLRAGAVAAQFPVVGRPTGAVRVGDQLTISAAGDGTLRRYDLAGLLRAVGTEGATGDAPTLDVRPAKVTRAWADGERSASTLSALDAGPHGPVGVYQVVDNVRKLSSAELAGDAYGTPMNGRARLEPALAGPCGARFASFTDDDRLLSGPVALAAAPQGDLVWVVGQFSHSVSVVRCAEAGPASRTTTVASFEVGAGARGIALSADGRRAFVDVGYDHEVAELRLPANAGRVGPSSAIRRREPVRTVHRTVQDHYLSALAQEGRKMFADGTDAHLTPFGVVTCASCHPGAGDDGLRWRIETKAITRKLRRTPAAWQIDPTVKPLHWDGEFATTDELVLTTVQQLLGGDGLLVDTAAISAYLAEAPAPPPAPSRTAAQRAAAQRGKDVFGSPEAGCSTCHAGPAGTDGKAHAGLPRTSDQAAELAEAVTPPLFGVRGKAPFGHDGRAADLEELLGMHLDGAGSPIDLTDDERVALVAYLRSR